MYILKFISGFPRIVQIENICVKINTHVPGHVQSKGGACTDAGSAA